MKQQYDLAAYALNMNLIDEKKVNVAVRLISQNDWISYYLKKSSMYSTICQIAPMA